MTEKERDTLRFCKKSVLMIYTVGCYCLSTYFERSWPRAGFFMALAITVIFELVAMWPLARMESK